MQANTNKNHIKENFSIQANTITHSSLVFHKEKPQIRSDAA